MDGDHSINYRKEIQGFYDPFYDEFVKSRKGLMIVIPAKAGIQRS
jgi:hypothetical protein